MLRRFALPTLILGALVTSPLAAQEISQAVPEREFATTDVVLQTTMGEITIALETERAPITANSPTGWR